jgi:hypothetical protein
MILETAQLLYTAHWVLGTPDFSDAPCRKSGERGYLSIKNKKHPSAIWVRESLDKYVWLCQLGVALCQEYTHRFRKTHSCEEHIMWLYENPPALKPTGWTPIRMAMPDEYKIHGNAERSYREYYRKGKTHILSYTKRHVPHWLRA